MNMDTKSHNLRFTSSLANYFAKHRSLPMQVNISSIANNTIENHSLQCFYKRYRTIGGEALPRDVVNMAIQRIKLPGTVDISASLQKSIFLAIARQFEAMQIKSSREVWRLTCIVSKEEYGFKIPFIYWYINRLITTH